MIPMTGEKASVAIEYIEKIKPTHAPGKCMSSNICGSSGAASPYTLFEKIMIV